VNREFLVDTNILLRLSANNQQQEALDRVLEDLKDQGNTPCSTLQVLCEYRTVCTRPVERNGLGMSSKEADQRIELIKDLFPLKEEASEAFIRQEWERLVKTYGAEGKQNHDTRLVAAMIANGVSVILTFNVSDFIRYHPTEISVLDAKSMIENK